MEGFAREIRDDDSVFAHLNLDPDGRAVDLRGAADYAAGHIPGAISVPVADLLADPAGSLPGVAANATIVLYGAGNAKGAEYDAAVALEEAGFTQVYYYSTGYANWIDGGRPTE